jgi:hypothetical protein
LKKTEKSDIIILKGSWAGSTATHTSTCNEQIKHKTSRGADGFKVRHWDILTQMVLGFTPSQMRTDRFAYRLKTLLVEIKVWESEVHHAFTDSKPTLNSKTYHPITVLTAPGSMDALPQKWILDLPRVSKGQERSTKTTPEGIKYIPTHLCTYQPASQPTTIP